MSKRLVFKLALMVAALGAVTLLQGCGDDDSLVYRFVYAPMGLGSPFDTAPVPGQAPTAAGASVQVSGSF